MKRIIVAVLGIILGLLPMINASECLFVTGVNSVSGSCNNAVYKNCDGNYYGKTFFSFRPQDSDSSRRILGWFNADYINFNATSIFSAAAPMRGILTISPQYTQSFHTKGLAEWFFFNGNDCMTVGIPNEYESFTIDGSQIGLSLGTVYDPETDSVSLITGKIGTVCAKPLVENFIIDLDYWYDLSAWHDRLWSRLELPVVYMKTNMGMSSCGKGTQVDEYPLGLFSLESTPVDEYGDYACNATPVPYNSIVCALQGDQGWGAVAPLKSGKFSADALSQWGAAGLHFDLGYDMYRSLPWYAAGSFHVVFPTGTRPKGTYVLEPVIGANKSWQVGATAIANYIKEFRHFDFGIYFYAVGTHLFKSKQDRVFALKRNGPGSQLLLLKQFQVGETGLVNAEREANIFCGEAKIGSALMFDGSLMFQFNRDKLVADIGYNFWVRTREKCAKRIWFRGFYEDAFGVKGDIPMEFQEAVGCTYNAPIQCINNPATEQCARICGPATEDATTITIQPCDVNYLSALNPTAMSHKVFAAVGYKSSWFVLLTGEAEFSSNNAALNQWGVMLKVGKDF